MAVVLVTYDLRAPGRNYQPVYDYLKTFTYCKDMESVWLLDTSVATTVIRDALKAKIDGNDKVFVVKITRDWASKSFGCGDWLNHANRSF
ncbi:hypothetical protein [Brevundimonas sp. CEF1]|uniref:hypothetical protein n=1 Tax=Brevundimonas sp. CEF1 TaxID=3442642 RepID=UPI003F515C51